MADDIQMLFHDAPTPAMSVDPHAVVEGGRGRRRRRRLVVAASALAVVTVAAVGIGVAERAGTSDRTTLPAERTPDLEPGPVEAEDPTVASLGRPFPYQDAAGNPLPGRSRFVLQVDPTAPDVLRYYGEEEDRRLTLFVTSRLRKAPAASGTSDSRRQAWTVLDAAPHVLLGALPGDTVRWIPVTPSGAQPLESEAARIPGASVVAFDAVYDDAADAAAVRAVVRLDAGNRVWGPDGRLPSATYARLSSAFVDPDLGIWGTFGNAGDLVAPLPKGSFSPVQRVDGGDVNPDAVLALVPADATDPEVTFGSGCHDTDGPRITPLGDGEHAVLYAECLLIGGDGSAIADPSVVLDGARVPIR